MNVYENVFRFGFISSIQSFLSLTSRFYYIVYLIRFSGFYRDDIESKRSGEASSSEKESEEIREEIQQNNNAPASDSTEKGDVNKERLRHVPIEREIYYHILIPQVSRKS
ncbi:Uncharacterized protein Rs2_15522 [Raphanus sativus]|nr:Uncharacterized protein Rs2_15522 [Raphanus sativus]